MHQVTASITPLPGAYQPLPACPFYPLLDHIPLIRLPGRRSVMKHAPSAATLAGQAAPIWCCPGSMVGASQPRRWLQ